MAAEEKTDKPSGPDDKADPVEAGAGKTVKKKVVKRKAVKKKAVKKKTVAKKAPATRGKVVPGGAEATDTVQKASSTGAPAARAAKEEAIPERRVEQRAAIAPMTAKTPQESRESKGGASTGFWTKVMVSLLIAVTLFLYIRAQVHDGKVPELAVEPQQIPDEPGRVSDALPTADAGGNAGDVQPAATVTTGQTDSRMEVVKAVPAPVAAVDARTAEPAREQAPIADAVASDGPASDAAKSAAGGSGGPIAQQPLLEAEPLQELVIEATRHESLEALRAVPGKGDLASEAGVAPGEGATSAQDGEVPVPGDGNTASGAMESAAEDERSLDQAVEPAAVADHPAAGSTTVDGGTEKPTKTEESGQREFRELFGYRRPVPPARHLERSRRDIDRLRYRRPDFQHPPIGRPGLPGYPYTAAPEQGVGRDRGYSTKTPYRRPVPRWDGYRFPSSSYSGYPGFSPGPAYQRQERPYPPWPYGYR